MDNSPARHKTSWGAVYSHQRTSATFATPKTSHVYRRSFLMDALAFLLDLSLSEDYHPTSATPGSPEELPVECDKPASFNTYCLIA